MRISEAILELIQLQIEYGDLEVGIKVSERVYDVQHIYCDSMLEGPEQGKTRAVLRK